MSFVHQRNKYVKYFTLFLILLIIGLNYCSKTLESSKKDYTTADKVEINNLLKVIENINSTCPESFYCKFNVEGHLHGAWA